MTTLGSSDTRLTTAAQSVMAAGSGENLLILKATVNNQDTASHTMTMYRVAVSGSPGADNIIVDALSLDAGETRALPVSGQPVTNGQTVQAVCSATNAMVLNLGWVVVA